MLKMTKERLEQYIKLKKELASIQKRLENNVEEYGVDVVRGSSAEHPYTERSILVCGSAPSRRSQTLMKRRTEIETEMSAVEAFIAGLRVSEDRLLMECRYIDGMPWKEVAYELGCSERTAFEIHKNIINSLR
ncbi:MAG: hypothetical protein LBR72_08480 [Oscillospiraceae bacterium]|jgi:DNA-directed RNA polymerase specialized sigma subunit|nr:hypothetical protein [Oscillospiraceae bacterium]